MQLIFDIAKCGKIRPSYKNLKFTQCDGVIGRSSDADYQLNDVDNYISGKHVYIEYKYEQYYIRDESTNGTFLKHPYKKLPKGIPHLISASDVYIIGDHELQARFSDNDYTDDFIIGSFSNEPEPLEAIRELIPDDDFLYEDVRDALNSEEERNNDEDVLDLLDGSKAAAVLLDGSDFDTIDEPIREEEIYTQYINAPTPVSDTKKKPYVPTPNQQLADSVRILEEKLGLEIIALENKERDLLMNEIADVLINSLEGLKNTLYINEKIKQDLQVQTQYSVSQNDPLRLGNSALQLLQDEKMKGGSDYMDVSTAVVRAFSQIDAHSIALHGASKNLMNTAFLAFSPKKLEHKFDSSGETRGLLPRGLLIWKAYVRMFEQMQENQETGVEILSPHFKSEYEKVAFSMALASSNIQNRQ